ncbi:hypothetical protein RZS08_15985, partial [Arthrospira platensis SPKY1]|nr:hypothetical protein [Arthrospira platensis SPKY1]
MREELRPDPRQAAQDVEVVEIGRRGARVQAREVREHDRPVRGPGRLFGVGFTRVARRARIVVAG